jgi:hypothetical protein
MVASRQRHLPPPQIFWKNSALKKGNISNINNKKVLKIFICVEYYRAVSKNSLV